MDNDTISRQAAIKAFKDFLTIHDFRGIEYLCSAVTMAVTMDGVNKILSDLPSAEPETIVRCKDCKHKYIKEKVWNWVWNCPFGLPGGEDFFCSYGARMEGESE